MVGIWLNSGVGAITTIVSLLSQGCPLDNASDHHHFATDQVTQFSQSHPYFAKKGHGNIRYIFRPPPVWTNTIFSKALIFCCLRNIFLLIMDVRSNRCQRHIRKLSQVDIEEVVVSPLISNHSGCCCPNVQIFTYIYIWLWVLWLNAPSKRTHASDHMYRSFDMPRIIGTYSCSQLCHIYTNCKTRCALPCKLCMHSTLFKFIFAVYVCAQPLRHSLGLYTWVVGFGFCF